MNARGFTLIELMVALGLGIMIVYVAVAGVRVTAQAITQANRLAIDNTIMRLGVQISLDNIDFWTDRDDPSSSVPKDQQLRLTSTDNSNPRIARGSLFTPFSVTRAATGYGAVTPTPTSVPIVTAGTNESLVGWDSNAWHAAASRTWCLTNRGESPGHPAHSKFSFFEQIQGKYFLLTAPGSNNIPAPNHPWHASQSRGLLLSLGAYGMMDYLPPNAPRIIYAPTANYTSTSWTAPWTISTEWVGGGGGYSWTYGFGSQYGDGHTGGGLYGLTETCAMAVPNREVSQANLSATTNRGYHVMVSGLGSWQLHNLFATQGFMQVLYDSENIDGVLCDGSPLVVEHPNPTLTRVIPRLANKPLHWPTMDVKSVRFLREGVFTNLQRVVITDTRTGEARQVSFSCFGTTLRGARQQRARGTAGTASGWVDPFSSTTPVTLDSP